MEQLDDTPVGSHHYSQEFRDKVLYVLMSHMVIMENLNREHPGHGVEYDGKYDDFQTVSNFYSDRNEMHKDENLHLTKPDPRPIYVRVPPDHPMCELNRLIENRKKDNRTLLGSIVARDAATGTGKTTLAVQLAKTLDENGWTADMATLDPDTYAEKYTSDDTPKQSCLLLDEAEQAADNRRSSSHGNVKLSHLWATMRYREIYSLTTLPSASMLDKRLKELADLYIVVVERGVAVVYQTKVDDTEGENYLRRLHRVRWQPLDDDPEYQKLTEKKAERMENYSENYAYGDDEEEIDPDQVRHEAEMEKRNELIERMADLDFTQEEIADVVELDRSTVSRILNGD
jgi:superfamily II DNA or RNA helicase